MEEVSKDLVLEFIENSKEIQSIEEKISSSIASFQKDLEGRKEKDVNLRNALKDSMITNRIKTFENDLIKVVYVLPSTRKVVDTERLKNEAPEIYDQYSKVSEVKDSIRISLK